MPNEKRLDPFKPQQPSIPGVFSSAQKAALAARAGIPSILWIAASVVGIFIIAGGLFFWSRSSSTKAASSVVAAAGADVSPPAAPEPPKAADSLPLGPGAIATTAELAKPWSSKRFMFRDPTTSAPEPAIVVRLPHGNYWGFSLREPFGNCELEYISDLQRLRTQYSFQADHPMVGDPCNHTVYDLLLYGSGAGNDQLVRGEIVQGTGIRPPMAIEIRTEGNKVLAVREE